ncbi:MAG: acyl-CoA synthetase FdrA [Anaerolineae bacterium]|nr:acyl-CoA synthetase FdrA [Anaerolineae bacterium]
MITLTRIKAGEYHDSVTLLNVAQTLNQAEGIHDAGVVMGTPANMDLLRSADLVTAQIEQATPNDLIIAVRGESVSLAETALALADDLLKAKYPGSDTASHNPQTLKDAIDQAEDANIVLISVAGSYAAALAHQALDQDKHVFLFSDNVSLEDEIKLKTAARAKHLFLMGPDAGTAIINGYALGFANRIKSGPVGLVAASGTGLQSVTSQLSNEGIGVSQAIGVGGRDLSAEVGGLMMIQGFQALQADANTKAVILISKPPAAKVVKKLWKTIAKSSKPTIVCFLGAQKKVKSGKGTYIARTLDEAALFATALCQDKSISSVKKKIAKRLKKTKRLAQEHRLQLNREQINYRGLFSGGTFCYETQLILGPLLELESISSNTPVDRKQKTASVTDTDGHLAIDFGADEFTVGRLHPMLDPELRNRRLLQLALEPSTAVIYFDIVLGYGVHPDPAGAVIPVLQHAKKSLKAVNRQVIFTASVCGTPEDPQNSMEQIQKLKDAGVIVFPSNASAAYFAGYVLSEQT